MPASNSDHLNTQMPAPWPQRLWRRVLWLALPALICAAALLANTGGITRTVDNRLLDLRMAATTLHPSGQVVFVAIDSKSLRAQGTWPWSRMVHATLLDQLVAAEAADIMFDIDFSFSGDASGDHAFVAALKRAGGATYLASFKQANRAGAGAEIVQNQPFPPFRANSWPVSVNVPSNANGQIRRYPTGAMVDGEFVPSAAQMLAGRYDTDLRDFEVNYALSPEAITTISAAEVLSGDFDPAAIAGRSVIIGASAIELGDHFAVPLHKVIPGALVHALAAETLLSGAAPRWLHPGPVAIATFAFMLLLQLSLGDWPWNLVIAIGSGGLLAEALAYLAFSQSAIAVPTALVHPALVAFGLCKLAAMLDLSAALLRRKDVQIANTRALLAHLFATSSDAVIIVNEDGERLMCSQSAERMLATEGGEFDLPVPFLAKARAAMKDQNDIANPSLDLLHMPVDGELRSIEYFATGSTFQELTGRNGRRIERRIGAITARDVTQLKEQEREIAYLSTHDERTGALRRRPFLEFLRLRLDSGAPVAIFALNLHRFKQINLNFGREFGDKVLAEVARRLEDLALGLSAVVRLDGDSFGFFTEVTPEPAQIDSMAQDILAQLCEPYLLAEANAQIGAKIGFVLIDDPRDVTAETALGRAEEALDTARTAGHSVVSRYAPDTAGRRARVREVERAMPGAIERSELYVVYQPQHRLSDGVLIGVEALVRWKNPDLGQVFPDEFIPIAESSGFITDLGRFVLRQSIQDALQLPETVTMAVNVSSLQLTEGDLHDDVAAALADFGLPPKRLCLELTESVFLSQTEATIETMQEIAWRGVTWALDDFGTGYSSMAYLPKLPLSKIKLDRSFTLSLGVDDVSLAVLRSAITLCQGLGLGLLCEGIETLDHVEILRREGCEEGQGYHYGRPQDLDEILTLCAVKADASAIA